jgi:hypothetical protein
MGYVEVAHTVEQTFGTGCGKREGGDGRELLER